jgi:predicted TIM-barrel fold metal-dependent hydrolase
MFGWFKPERRERRKKVRQDRKHLEKRARRFLKRYLEADDTRKPQFYRAVEEISRKCQPAELSSAASDLDDSRIAEAASQAAMQMVMDHNGRLEEGNRVSDFVTDACATVAVAYHRAAAVYVEDEEMQELGTAAVHLLTMATSYMITQKE